MPRKWTFHELHPKRVALPGCHLCNALVDDFSAKRFLPEDQLNAVKLQAKLGYWLLTRMGVFWYGFPWHCRVPSETSLSKNSILGFVAGIYLGL